MYMYTYIYVYTIDIIIIIIISIINSSSIIIASLLRVRPGAVQEDVAPLRSMPERLGFRV